ncbi:hypothetical protein KQI52_05260 [bacterium]|nr:hypothetical protein [bacterium]
MSFAEPYSDELAEMLLNLEASLNQQAFNGIPLGSTLAASLILDFWNGNARWSRGARWRQRLQRVQRFYKPYGLPDNHRSTALHDLPRDGVLVTWLRDDPRYNGMIQPLLNRLPDDGTIVLVRSRGLMQQTGNKAATLLEAPPPPDKLAWQRTYRRMAPYWAKTLESYVRDHGLDALSVPMLRVRLLIQSQRVSGYRHMLEVLRPKAILTEFDRNIYSSCLVLAAKSLGIPTATLVHGTINPPYGYNPVLADRIFAWGTLQREQLINLKTPPEKIRLTGFARVARPEPKDASAIKQAAGLPADKPVVLLATNPIEPKAHERLITTYCTAFAGRKDITVVVRTHPAEGDNAWEAYRDRFPFVYPFGRGDQSVEDSLAMTDVFVCNNTGMSMDALLHDVPVVLLDVPGSSLLSNRDLADAGVAQITKSDSELASTVDEILKSSGLAGNLAEKREAYLKSMYFAMGDEAATLAAKELMALAGADVPATQQGSVHA